MNDFQIGHTCIATTKATAALTLVSSTTAGRWISYSRRELGRRISYARRELGRRISLAGAEWWWRISYARWLRRWIIITCLGSLAFRVG
jgi:hypothetical protein